MSAFEHQSGAYKQVYDVKAVQALKGLYWNEGYRVEGCRVEGCRVAL